MIKDSKESRLFQPHDSLFKSSTQNLNTAKEVTTEYFPKAQVALMDIETLRPEPSDFLHDNLKHSQADTLYSLETTEGLGYIYTLMEHQSTPDPKMPLRILEYKVQIMQRHLNKGHEHCPLVFPMVIHAGKQTPYPEKTDLYEMFENSELAKAHMFQPFRLIDLKRIDDKEIAKSKYSALMFWALKLRALGQLKRLSAIIVEQGLDEFIQTKIDSRTLKRVLIYTPNDPNISDKESLIKSIKALGKEK